MGFLSPILLIRSCCNTKPHLPCSAVWLRCSVGQLDAVHCSLWLDGWRPQECRWQRNWLQCSIAHLLDVDDFAVVEHVLLVDVHSIIDVVIEQGVDHVTEVRS